MYRYGGLEIRCIAETVAGADAGVMVLDRS
jgi:hypothetical protein